VGRTADVGCYLVVNPFRTVQGLRRRRNLSSESTLSWDSVNHMRVTNDRPSDRDLAG